MDSKKTPLAVSVFTEILFIICLLFVWLFPGFSKTVFQSWMHGIDLATIWNPTFSVSSIILGIVSVFVITYVLVWIFVAIYKAITK